ncbi:MAG: carboxypeptidase-like regulatory domain-containing protein [Flavobacteriales bacterium]|nr:carboxypeptidase-like regulatory domain-containing protein [Flavobacteriales bacterium]
MTLAITDSTSGEALIAAIADVKDTTMGATPGVDGRAIITGIPDGKHIIAVSYMGYDTKECILYECWI